MNFTITKEDLEQQIGYKINDFKLEPLYENDTCIGLSVFVIPVQEIEKIETIMTISNDLKHDI